MGRRRSYYIFSFHNKRHVPAGSVAVFESKKITARRFLVGVYRLPLSMAIPDEKHGVSRNPPEDYSPTDQNSDSIEAVERGPHEVEDPDPLQQVATKESLAHRASQDIRRTASNVITNVSSHITTRSWPEPPPPPDGGLKAWTQVAMGWLVMVRT